jgi:hypothetical protein
MGLANYAEAVSSLCQHRTADVVFSGFSRNVTCQSSVLGSDCYGYVLAQAALTVAFLVRVYLEVLRFGTLP